MLDQLTNPFGAAQEEVPPAPIAEFDGMVECPLFTEEAHIGILADSILVSARMDQIGLPYARISAIAFQNYCVALETEDGPVRISRMGQEAEWLYEKLCGAYNDAVLDALHIAGEPKLTAPCAYQAEEPSEAHGGEAEIRLYEDCIALLPPNDQARRIPLCFLTAMEKANFTLTLTLSTGERYALSRMGQALEDLDRLLTEALRSLREKSTAFHKELAPNLAPMQAAIAAKCMPLGRAADWDSLKRSTPPLAKAIEEKIRASRIAGTWRPLQEPGGGKGLYVGILPPQPPSEADEAGGLAAALPEMLGSLLSGEAEEAEAPALQPTIWVIAPMAELAATELALPDAEAAATYLYRVEGDWTAFAEGIARALEATGFDRELVLLPEEKLAEKPKAAMLVRRTPALIALRKRFAGRAIHSSPARWKRDIEACSGKAAQPAADAPTAHAARFCGQCGAALTGTAKFCGACGAPLTR